MSDLRSANFSSYSWIVLFLSYFNKLISLSFFLTIWSYCIFSYSIESCLSLMSLIAFWRMACSFFFKSVIISFKRSYSLLDSFSIFSFSFNKASVLILWSSILYLATSRHFLKNSIKYSFVSSSIIFEFESISLINLTNLPFIFCMSSSILIIWSLANLIGSKCESLSFVWEFLF